MNQRLGSKSVWIEGSTGVEEIIRVALRQALDRWMLVRILEGEIGSLSVLKILNVVKGAILAALFAFLGLLDRE